MQFYSPKKVLSYNALFNFVLGARGFGKTYGFKKYCLLKCIAEKRKFIYLRRYKTEINSKKMQSFFNDINYEFDNKLKCDKNIFYYNNEQIGMALPLSTYISNKSIVLNEYDFIIFDEFIIDKGNYHYLSKEVETFLEFYFTVARFDNKGHFRDVKVFFLANALSQVNPYFTYFNITIPDNFTGIKRINSQIVLEMCESDLYFEEMKKTKAYKLIEGTQYEEYAFENDFLRDNYEFIEKKSKNAKYWFSMCYDNNNLGVWIDYTQGLIYVSKQVDTKYYINYTFTVNDHKPNALLINSCRNDEQIKRFRFAFENGLVRFDSLQTKYLCYNINRLFI